MPRALSIAAVFFLQALTQIPASAQTTATPACSESSSIAFVDYLHQVRSLEELSDGANVIVDATVQSIGPGVGGDRETEAVFTATKVLKGPSTLERFAISHIKARGMLALQPGQRFILFLGDETPIRLSLLPDRPGVARYGVVGDYSGTFCIDRNVNSDIVRLGSGSSLQKYQGALLDKTLADIRTYLDIPRLNGRITVDGGVFPPPGMPPTFFITAIKDPRLDFRIILTPTDPGAAAGTSPRTTVALRTPPGFVEPAPSSGATLVPINKDGAFTIPLQRGTYSVSVEGLPFGYNVKSMLVDSTDLATEPLRITASVSSDFRITLAGKRPDEVSAGMRVSGQVTGIPAGLSTNKLWVVLRSDTAPDFRSDTTQASTDGRFEFVDVPTGKYTLRSVPASPIQMGFGWIGQSSVAVAVGQTDLNIDLPMFAGTPVSGRIADKNGNSVTTGPSFITFTSSNSRLEVRFPADNTFKAWLLPGEYSVTVQVFSGGNFVGGNFSVKTISSDSIDLLKTTLKIDGTTPVTPILITLQ